jgi:hypothetical protein
MGLGRLYQLKKQNKIRIQKGEDILILENVGHQ